MTTQALWSLLAPLKRVVVSVTMMVLVIMSGCLLFFFAFFLLALATSVHWSLGAIVAILYCGLSAAGLTELRSREAVSDPLYEIGYTVVITVVIGTLVAAWISFILANAGLAVYESQRQVTIDDFALYFIWVLLDVLPGLRVTDTLEFVAPLKPKGVVAGIPVLGFKVYILFGILNALRTWWIRREGATRPAEG